VLGAPEPAAPLSRPSALAPGAAADQSATLSRPTEEGRGKGGFIGKLSATGIGTAHHVFFEHLDLARAASEADLAAEKQRLCAAGVLKPEEAAALDLSGILAFWTTPIGVAIREVWKGQSANPSTGSVRRELPFTAAFSPLELAAFADQFANASVDDFVVVQGAVDLAVLLPGEIWLVDFKTDHVSDAELPERAREHERQLRLYAAALDRIYGRPVTRCVLHFLALGRSWKVADPMRGLAGPRLGDERAATPETSLSAPTS